MSEGGPSASGAGAAPTAAPAQGGEAQAGSPREQIKNPTTEGSRGSGSLPGVLEHAGENDADVSEALFGEEPGDERSGDRKTRLRGPDGKFIKQSSDTGEELVSPALPDGEIQPEPAPAKFKFAGEEFESQDKAEQNFKTLRGMYKADQAKIKQLGEYVPAYEAWKGHAEALAARIAELEKGGAAPQPQPGVQPSRTAELKGTEVSSVEDVLKQIDWDAYNYIATKGSLAKGGEYLIGEVMRMVKEQMIPSAVNQLREEMMNSLAPFQESAQASQTVEAMTRATQQLATLQTSDGRVAFPELSDVKAVEEIGYYWGREAESEADAERRLRLLQTPAGLLQAIAFYRLQKSLINTPAPEPSARPAEELPANPVAPGPASSLSVRGDEGFHTGPSSGLSPEMARLVAAMGKPEMIDSTLGFARNPRR
jgi:hypothetical protein